jgi:hypothetical protein
MDSNEDWYDGYGFVIGVLKVQLLHQLRGELSSTSFISAVKMKNNDRKLPPCCTYLY